MMKDLNKVYVENNNSIISFEWMLIDKCQNKCSYCSSVDFNKNTLKNGNAYKIGLYKLSTLNQYFKVDIVGGEPMLHPNIADIIEKLTLNKYCKYLDMCSNMKKSVNDYLLLNNSKLKITASFHIEYQKGFKEKVLELHKAGLNIAININMYPEKYYWQTIKELIDYCNKYNIKYEYNMLNETSHYKPNYTDEFYDFFKDEFKKDIEYIIHEFSDGTKEVLSETELFKKNISYFDMKCKPMQFQIELDGSIINDCTKEKINKIDLNDIIKEVKCPMKLCHNQIKYKYEKTI